MVPRAACGVPGWPTGTPSGWEGPRAMTEFQLLMLRRLDGVPRRVGGLWLWPEDLRRDPALAERAYWAAARDENRGMYDFVISAPLGTRVGAEEYRPASHDGVGVARANGGNEIPNDTFLSKEGRIG